MRILFFIGQLNTGGTQVQLVQQAAGLAELGHQVLVATMHPGGDNWNRLTVNSAVELRPLFDATSESKILTIIHLVNAPFRLRKLIKDHNPDIVYSMLYMANLIAFLASLGSFARRLVWGIRASNSTRNWKRGIPFTICKWLSPQVPLIIANSYRGQDFHQQSGYRPQKWKVIPNGIDTRRFSPTPYKNTHTRAGWQVGESARLIGLIGRIVPEKDPFTFINAAQILISKIEDLSFVFVGDGKKSMLAAVKNYLENLRINNHITLAGSQTDMPAVYNALDILCSASIGEGFPNVIGEAMSCGVPCVVTDAGDSALIVGDLGWVVPTGDPQALAGALLSAVDSLQSIDHQAIRNRIVEHFSLDQMVCRTESAMLELISKI